MEWNSTDELQSRSDGRKERGEGGARRTRKAVPSSDTKTAPLLRREREVKYLYFKLPELKVHSKRRGSSSVQSNKFPAVVKTATEMMICSSLLEGGVVAASDGGAGEDVDVIGAT